MRVTIIDPDQELFREVADQLENIGYDVSQYDDAWLESEQTAREHIGDAVLANVATARNEYEIDLRGLDQSRRVRDLMPSLPMVCYTPLPEDWVKRVDSTADECCDYVIYDAHDLNEIAVALARVTGMT